MSYKIKHLQLFLEGKLNFITENLKLKSFRCSSSLIVHNVKRLCVGVAQLKN